MEWNFFVETMNVMGFHNDFIAITMGCISSMSYSIILNGSPCGRFYPLRGLRQGDPFSPCLLIIGTELFSQMFRRAITEGLIDGDKTIKRGSNISYLLMAQDSFLFCNAYPDNVRDVKNIIVPYCESHVQLAKDRARRKTCNMLMHILLVMRMAEEERYLANPLMINKRKTTTFDSLVNKSRSKIGSCKAPLLSRSVTVCLICRLLHLYHSMIGVLKGQAKACLGPAHIRVGRVELGPS